MVYLTTMPINPLLESYRRSFFEMLNECAHTVKDGDVQLGEQ